MELAKKVFISVSLFDLRFTRTQVQTNYKTGEKKSSLLRSLSNKIPDQFAFKVKASVEKYRLCIYRVFLVS